MPSLEEYKTFVVLCAVHSGSSMLAGIMHQMGITMTKEPEKKDEFHPRGTWERHDFMNMNNKILSRASGDWRHPPSIDNVLKLVKNNEFAKQVKSLIKDNQCELWGWKCPRNCLTAPIWHPYLTKPHYLVLRRNLKAMVGSWTFDIYHSKFGDTGVGEAYEIIKDCYSRIDRFVQDKENIIEFKYETMLENPGRELEKLAEFVGGEVTENALIMVDNKLRHF